MKKVMQLTFLSILIMILIPWFIVHFVDGDNGMAACFIMIYIINPIYAVYLGVESGKDMDTLWVAPILISLFFLDGARSNFKVHDEAFNYFALAYTGLSLTSMFITRSMVNKKSETKHTETSEEHTDASDKQ